MRPVEATKNDTGLTLREAAARWAREYGATQDYLSYPRQLERIAMARILLAEDRIDEALDALTRRKMQEELLAIWSRRRKTVLFVTHDVHEAVLLADRIAVFSARPGTIREEIAVPLPRPRTLELKRSQAFVGLVDRIWKLIEAEVRAGLKQG